MTCIIAIPDGDSVRMAADSCIGEADWKDVTLQEKVFIEKLSDGTPIGVGLSGSPRVAQVLRYTVSWDSLIIHDDVPEWMVTELIPAMRQALSDHDVPGEDDKPGTLDGNLLIAVKGRVFEVHARWQIHEPAAPFAVIGIDDAALGAIHCALALGCEDYPRIMDIALEAASRWAFGVGPPFHHWTVG